MYIPKSKEWFLERIGKRIMRDRQGLKDCCDACRSIRHKGLIVQNKEHAEILATLDSDYAADGIYSNYKDPIFKKINELNIDYSPIILPEGVVDEYYRTELLSSEQYSHLKIGHAVLIDGGWCVMSRLMPGK